MCGITGYWSQQAFPEPTLQRMNDRIRHRGPDADGVYRDGPVALAHRRLAILDLASSIQPMSTPDSQVTLVFNGEIYNFPALREQLSRMGYVFQTHGDTETLLYAYCAWGTRLLERLQGMFAFAIWDKRKQQLFLARDHMGVKPLFYQWNQQTLVFASELKALIEHPSVSREIDLDAVGTFLECQFIPAPQTIYRQVKRLPAAHAMLLADGKLETWRYWSPDFTAKLELDEVAAEARLHEEVRGAVARMMVSDVPIGSFLSGGLDSSLVSALMTDISGKPIETFSVGFQGKVRGSEHVYSQRVAEHIASRHHSLMLGIKDILDGIDDLTETFDEPFGDQAALPTMLLSRYSRNHVTVVLTGEGADEVFCGYSNYWARVREEEISRWLGHSLSPLRYLVRALPGVLRKDRLVKAIGEPLSRRYATIPNIFDRALQPGLFSPAFFNAQRSDIACAGERAFHECNSPSYLEKLMHIDSRVWLPEDLLLKVDHASMYASIEARVPFLDHKVVEFSASLAPNLKHNGLERKYLLKKVAERYLPKDIVYRGKQGFVMPLSEWLDDALHPQIHAAIGVHGLGKRGLFRHEALETLMHQHRQGSKNHAGRFWTLYALERWFERHQPDFRL
jgi:asparagine synthase (glutamine-hydrolysing)